MDGTSRYAKRVRSDAIMPCDTDSDEQEEFDSHVPLADRPVHARFQMELAGVVEGLRWTTGAAVRQRAGAVV